MLSFIFESPKTIGCSIITIAVLSEAVSQGYKVGVVALPLVYPLLKDLDVEKYSSWEGAPFTDVKVPLDNRYLNHLPHVRNLPNKSRKGWLGEWMAVDIQDASDGEIIISPKRKDMKICLTSDEIAEAYEEKMSISGKYMNKPVTHLVITTSSINKNIPRDTLENVITKLNGETVFCMAEPLGIPDENKQFYKDLGVVILGEKGLRDAMGRLHVADAVVTADTWTLHGAIASRGTGTQFSLKKMGYIPTNKQVIAVLGSSNPKVVAGYDSMKTVTTNFPCSGCGAHAYDLLQLLEDKTGIKYHDLGDGSGCVHKCAVDSKVPPCMKHVRAEGITTAIGHAFKYGKASAKPLNLVKKV